VPDPQLHSHVAVIAAVRQDGKIAAVESRQLYLAAREGGAWYRAEVAHELGQFGLQIEKRSGKGERYFGIEGVSKDLSEHWSSRGEDVQRAAQLFRQRYGREPGPGELDGLTLATRGGKSTAAVIDVNAAWRALGEEHGQSGERSEELFDERNIDNRPNVDLAKELLSEVTKEHSMITERELRAKAYELSAGVCRPGEADRLVGELARGGELVRLEDGTWTTRRLRELEQTTLEIAERRATENALPVSERSLKQARREVGREIRGSLTPEQREALERITGPGGVAVLVGRAGTGKGVTISAAARAWQLEGDEVIGTTIAGATAQRLKADAKLDRAFTTDGLLGGIENGRITLGARSVVIMDEAGMGDSDRIARLVKMTAERDSKLLLVGDGAQLSSIGPGGLFEQLEGKVPTAELTEVHRARHGWEREAWERIRAGEPGPALAQYQAHDRLHIHDTRAQAAEAMVDNWDQTRKRQPDRQAVMITDASNKERDQINAMAQERRAQAGELGAHRVELPGKPYGLASGDEIIFTAQYHIPGERRVENGITGTILHTSRQEDRVTIGTQERPPREVDLDTSEFSDISLAYAVHVHKGQGLTTETSGILTGGWQTDKEHAYVAVSRAREQTQIYASREDLGEQGMDTGAIERLATRMQRSRAQEATIAKQTAERDDDAITRDQPHRARQERTENPSPSPVPQTDRDNERDPINIHDATPSDIHLNVLDLGEIKLAYTQNPYNLPDNNTAEPTYALFGGWQTDHELGYIAVTQSQGNTNIHATTEDRDGERDIETELINRIEAVIERSHTQATSATPQEANTPEPDRENHEHQHDQPTQIEPSDRSYIDQIIQEQQDRQQAWEQGIDQDHDNDNDNDRGFGIE
jgi:hypothetical protein